MDGYIPKGDVGPDRVNAGDGSESCGWCDPTSEHNKKGEIDASC